VRRRKMLFSRRDTPIGSGINRCDSGEGDPCDSDPGKEGQISMISMKAKRAAAELEQKTRCGILWGDRRGRELRPKLRIQRIPAVAAKG